MAGPRAAHVSAPSFADLCKDDAAFTTWYQAALPRVYGFVYARAGGDSALAEDITAQAFTDGIRGRSGFDGRSDPITWICTIARNRLIDHYRRAARERKHQLRLVVTDIGMTSRELRDVEDHDAVLAVLEILPVAERTALTLRYLDGYSVPETASIIGRTVPATESLLGRARERVRSSFPGGAG